MLFINFIDFNVIIDFIEYGFTKNFLNKLKNWNSKDILDKDFK